MSEVIRINASKFNDYDLIVGIPRSGMLPASMIALYMNKPLASLDDWLDGKDISKGSTRKSKASFRNYQDASKVLVVDDSVNSGGSLLKVKERITPEQLKKVSFLAIYESSSGKFAFDFALEKVERPRVFEWNIYHTSMANDTLYDIDGVLCQDPLESENDDGIKYSEFLNKAVPLFIPTYKVKALVTNRLEKYRPQTEQWLARYGVQYENLYMSNYDTKEQRQNSGDYISHKANIYKKSDAILFIESCPKQAQGIASFTGKFVYCVDSNQMYGPDSILRVIKKPSSYRYHAKRQLKKIPFFIEFVRWIRKNA
ncbi:phosphoribosyltransferase family protein [Vibrio cyclitrophicus]